MHLHILFPAAVCYKQVYIDEQQLCMTEFLAGKQVWIVFSGLDGDQFYWLWGFMIERIPFKSDDHLEITFSHLLWKNSFSKHQIFCPGYSVK